MPFVRKMPPSQCSNAKMITAMKELFAEHGIPEIIWMDNGPQFNSHLFAEFTKDWNIDHELSSPQNPRSNSQAKSAVKIVKGLLTHAKYSGQDPHLALLAYRSTPVDAYLWSLAEILYQHVIQTTVPQRIRNKDPCAEIDQERLNDWAVLSTSYHDCHSQTKSPYYAGQTVSVLNDAKTFWLPATVIRQADHGSYLVEVIGRGRYRWARDHICEQHPEAEPMRKDTSSPGNVAPTTPEWPGAPPVQKPLTVQKSPPVPKSPPV